MLRRDMPGGARWYDLIGTRLSRRDLLRIGADAAAVIALGGCAAGRENAAPRFATNPFDAGVASGDPLPGGVVLWTRLSPAALSRAGALPKSIAVRWEVAEDDGFRRIARRGSALARPELGHSVHVEAEGLRPARPYWYRFDAGGHASPVGRTFTAPAPDAAPDRLRFAFASCQNWEHGLFTALRHLAEEDVELVVHLGDYIYERRFAGTIVREHEAGEVFSLDQYRARYALYRSDPHLQAAHAAAPWIVTTDDHEVANNYADGIAQDGTPPAQFLLRRAAAYQAFYEFMPLRRSSMPRGPDMEVYRRFRFGGLARMHVLDTRQYRTDQPCGDGQKPRCAAADDPSATMMGDTQERWLLDGLREHGARWNVLANQVMIAQLARLADGVRTFSMDRWDAYTAARARLMRFFADARPDNVVAITGDIHSSWVADLRLDFDDAASPPLATELVGTSLSSGGDGSDDASALARIRADNPHIHFYDRRRGYVRCTLTPERWTADYRIVPYVSRPGAPIETRATFVIEAGRAGAQRA